MQDKMLCNVNYPEGYTETARILNVRRDYISLESKRRYFILQEKNGSEWNDREKPYLAGVDWGETVKPVVSPTSCKRDDPFLLPEKADAECLTNNKFSRRYGNPWADERRPRVLTIWRTIPESPFVTGSRKNVYHLLSSPVSSHLLVQESLESWRLERHFPSCW